MIENCGRRDEKPDYSYLEEVKFNMHYARWFRPILGAALACMLLVMLSVLDQYNMISHFKALY